MGIDYVIENEELEKQFYLTLAECYHSLGKDKDSDKYFDNYLAIDSTNAYLMNNYAYYLAKRNNKLDKALNLSRKSIEIEPFNSSFLDTYSWILYTLAEYDKALNYIQRAYKYGGNKNPVVLEHYGDILMKIGNTVEAIDRWKDAYQLK
jgi:Tfp pilus assembly protein PilF